MGFGLPVESWERFLLVMDSGLPIESWERFCCMDSGLPIESWERFRWMDSGLPIELWEHFLLVKDLGLPNRVVAGYDMMWPKPTPTSVWGSVVVHGLSNSGTFKY